MNGTRCVQRNQGGYLPIEAYGVIGNGRTMALVGNDGSIDWCPLPRIDAPSVFGRILDSGRGGHWRIAPLQPWTTEREYLPDTNILVTRFHVDGGVVEVVDLMPSVAFGADLGLAQWLREGLLLRVIRGIEGSVELEMELLPRFDYGRDTPTVELLAGRGAVLCSPGGSLRVASTLPLAELEGGVSARFRVAAGEEEVVSANFHHSPAVVWSDIPRESALDLLRRETEGWRGWMTHCSYDGPYADYVRRSALVLKLLDDVPSGAMVAAATTSLPETMGGERNWDYRYAWIRDTSYALHAFYSIGFRDEAEGFLQWVIDVTRDDPAALQIMYRVDGGSDLEEIHLDHLEGYRGSRPVRIGNGASTQRQLDRFGEVLDAAWVHRRFGGVINAALWDYLIRLTELVEEHWQLPDAGIWEVRSEERRMTYSNVMCWVAIDRAIRLAHIDDRDAPLERWCALRERIRADVMEYGIAPGGYFSQGFGDDHLDAAALSFPLRDFIEVDHPVMRETIERVVSDLSQGELVWRYASMSDATSLDGLIGHEGAFVLCSFWLIDCLVGLGELDRAEDLLRRLLARANDLGLYSEEIEHPSGAFLGNFPQAFSHLGLINAVVNLARARGHVEQGAPGRDEGHVTGAIPAGPETRRILGRQDRS